MDGEHIRENPIEMGWFGGFSPYFWFNTHLGFFLQIQD